MQCEEIYTVSKSEYKNEGMYAYNYARYRMQNQASLLTHALLVYLPHAVYQPGKCLIHRKDSGISHPVRKDWLAYPVQRFYRHPTRRCGHKR